MSAAENRDASPKSAPTEAAAPYSFRQLLERQVERLGLDLVFQIHVPKASGGTVNVLFRQNNFLVLNFDMSTSDFFQEISEEKFLEAYQRPPPRQSYFYRVISVSTIPFFAVSAFRT